MDWSRLGFRSDVVPATDGWRVALLMQRANERVVVSDVRDGICLKSWRLRLMWLVPICMNLESLHGL